MRPLVLSVLACCAASGAFAACVDGGRATITILPGPDATADDAADAAQDAVEELVTSSVCGREPWVTLGIQVLALTLEDPDGSPLPGAKFTSPLCNGFVQTSDDAGIIQGKVSSNRPFYGRLTATGYVSELAPEEVFDADSTGNPIQMIPTLFEGVLLPGFDASASSAIVVAVQKTTSDAAACSALDGVSLGVVGHPEATVTYFSDATIPMAVPGATATTTKGLAAITGLDASAQYVTLSATKAGCHVETAHGTLTGRVPLENGYVSLMAVYVTP